eukprot:7909290-Alexandrium_andersonii.AAC.1
MVGVRRERRDAVSNHSHVTHASLLLHDKRNGMCTNSVALSNCPTPPRPSSASLWTMAREIRMPAWTYIFWILNTGLSTQHKARL